MITRRQALRYMSVKALRHLVESGRWQRVRPGVFVAHTAALSDAERHWVAVLGAGGDRLPGSVCLAGLTALRAWGLRGVEARLIHVLVPIGARAPALRGVRVHRTRVPPHVVNHPPTAPATSPPGRSVVDAAQWARSEREARLIVAASFQQSLVRLPDINRAVSDQPHAFRRALVLRTATDCAGGSHSLGELDLLALCRRARLPLPIRQAPRRDRDGRLRFLDVVFDPWRVAVEIDGAHHLEVAQMWDDAVRANALELDGYVLLRYPAHALRTQPQRIAAEIREALLTNGWRRGSR